MCPNLHFQYLLSVFSVLVYMKFKCFIVLIFIYQDTSCFLIEEPSFLSEEVTSFTKFQLLKYADTTENEIGEKIQNISELEKRKFIWPGSSFKNSRVERLNNICLVKPKLQSRTFVEDGPKQLKKRGIGISKSPTVFTREPICLPSAHSKRYHFHEPKKLSLSLPLHVKLKLEKNNEKPFYRIESLSANDDKFLFDHQFNAGKIPNTNITKCLTKIFVPTLVPRLHSQPTSNIKTINPIQPFEKFHFPFKLPYRLKDSSLETKSTKIEMQSPELNSVELAVPTDANLSRDYNKSITKTQTKFTSMKEEITFGETEMNYGNYQTPKYNPYPSESSNTQLTKPGGINQDEITLPKTHSLINTEINMDYPTFKHTITLPNRNKEGLKSRLMDVFRRKIGVHITESPLPTGFDLEDFLNNMDSFKTHNPNLMIANALTFPSIEAITNFNNLKRIDSRSKLETFIRKLFGRPVSSTTSQSWN